LSLNSSRVEGILVIFVVGFSIAHNLLCLMFLLDSVFKYVEGGYLLFVRGCFQKPIHYH
jgi:hypothetical protein